MLFTDFFATVHYSNMSWLCYVISVMARSLHLLTKQLLNYYIACLQNLCIDVWYFLHCFSQCWWCWVNEWQNFDRWVLLLNNMYLINYPTDTGVSCQLHINPLMYHETHIYINCSIMTTIYWHTYVSWLPHILTLTYHDNYKFIFLYIMTPT